MSLRSILGGSSRIRKASKASSGGANRSSPSKSSSSPKTARRKASASKGARPDDGDDDLFQDKLDDFGLVRTLATDLNLRDTAQAIH